MKIIRLRNVETKTGKKRSAIYDDIAKGIFPRQVKLGPKSVGWIEDEIDAWIKARVAERDRERESA
jgi:prophage regulatory protein